ncbi:MAG: NAD(P)/FAD-dependent oxidoreductase [Desulfurococcaceae archaeon]
MNYDAVVIGSGVGGYSTAISLSNRERSVAIIEEHLVGGECVNYGCVPTKAFYHFSEALRILKKINSEAYWNWKDLVKWVNELVSDTRSNLIHLLEKKGVEIIHGRALLKDHKHVRIGDFEVSTNAVVLATGTDPKSLKNLVFDNKHVLSNRDVLKLEEKPSSILIVGGGVIGIEFANIFSNLGINIKIVEALDHILPFIDQDVALSIKKYMVEKGVEIYEKTYVENVSKIGDELSVKLSNGESLKVDHVFVAVGREPKTRGIGLENTGVELDNAGFIKVGDGYETSAKDIYAVGDVTGPPLLAHKAIIEGILASKSIVGIKVGKLDSHLIPQTIFSGLEVAFVGYTEKELIEKKIGFKKYKLPIYYLSAVRIKDSKYSFVKILVNEHDPNMIHGVQIVSPNASEVISSFIPILMGRIALSEAATTPYPHLTVSETVREIAEFVLGESIHVVIKK